MAAAKLTAARIGALVAKFPPVRLPEGGELHSPDGEHVVRSVTKRGAIELDGLFIYSELSDIELAFTTTGHLLIADHNQGCVIAWNLEHTKVVGTLAIPSRPGNLLVDRLRERKERGKSHGSLDGGGRRLSREELHNLTLEPGDGVENFTLERCQIHNCKAGAPHSTKPAYLRNITVERGDLSRSTLDVVVLEDITLTATKLAGSLQMRGCRFKHVTLTGHVGSFDASVFGWPMSTEKRFQTATKKFYAEVDWALDLSGITSGSFLLGDIPIDLVRPNPDLHFRLDRERADYDAIKKVKGVEYTYFTNDVRDLAASDHKSVLLMANPKSKSFKLDLAALQNLRRAGFVT